MATGPRSPSVAERAQETARVGDMTSLKQGVAILRNKAARSPQYYSKSGGLPSGQPKAVGPETIPINAGATVNISFGGGFSFQSATSYVVKLDMDGAAVPTAVPAVFNKSANGFSIKNLDGSNRNVQWEAVGI